MKDDAVVALLANATHISENTEFQPEALPSLRQELKRYWLDSASASFVTGEETVDTREKRSDSWFQRVYDQHNQDGRHYHNVVHLKEMLEYLQILRDNDVVSASQYTPMVWATFFHDAIYDPKSNRNEKDSALLFQEFAKDVPLSSSLAKMVVTMILATEKHKTLPSTEEDDNDLAETTQAYFLDMDMAVLGKKPEAYRVYASLIRQEYRFVEHDLYCSKRAEILQSFLDNSDTIFLTKEFQQAMEQRARDNIAQEIEFLKSGTIPGG